ncbi:Predicted membrane protein [Methanopyrus kandleri AV19]|uniref:Predicted membrane protein n=2 Tax=Methanopyrus kandleri TaxID=2320 RepID=Q8TXG9_METKA|nr:Predicted membrane protein [Methanopyrus kandleri AV19]
MLRNIGPVIRLIVLILYPLALPLARILVIRMSPEYLRRMDYLLQVSNIDVPYEIYLSASLIYVLIGMSISGPLIPKLGSTAFLLAVMPLYLLIHPRIVQSLRIKDIEENLPDALRQMVEELRAGLSIFETIRNVAESDYGELSREFRIVVRDMDTGKTFEEAILDMAERVNSELLTRAVRLTVRISMSGGALADVLEAVENDIREVRRIELERKAITTMPCLALALGGLISGLPVGVSIGAVIGVAMMERMGPTYAMLPMYLQAKDPLASYPLVLGLLSGMAIGIIRYGNMKRGLVFGLPLGAAAAGVYLAIVSVMPSFLAAGGM